MKKGKKKMKIVDNKLKFSTLTKRKTTNRCIFHHSAGNGSVEQIHQIHKNNGWSGIGYHLYVRTDGTIYQGRPINMIGAHASNNNYDSIGVCFEGNFETSNMTDKQIEAGKEIVSYLKNKYKNIYFQKHKDVSSTACPGKNFKFDTIVENVSAKTTNKTNKATTQKIDKYGRSNIVQSGQMYANVFCNLNIKMDGIRGNETKKAGIKVLQSALNFDYKSGLVVDGIVGSKTKSALTGRYISVGKTGYLVTALQILLLTKGYSCKVRRPGSFDDNLKKIVKNYQKANGLTVDGIAGYYTFMSLIK